jgi:ribosome-associated protein
MFLNSCTGRRWVIYFKFEVKSCIKSERNCHRNPEKTMKQQRAVKITDRLFISEDELSFTASRSSGAGGQNVNKVSTRITLWFDVFRSPSLSDEEKQLILNKFPTRINKTGILWVNAQQTRSQAGNRELARQRFVELLAQALVQPRFRKKTRIPRRVQEERISDKKRRSRVKANRSPASYELMN